MQKIDEIDVFGYSLGGSVSQMMGRTPESALPELTPAQIANISAAFADPIGLADITGQFPAFPEPGVSIEEMVLRGERSPSLAENIREGSLGSAGLQMLGMIPVVGGALRSARGLGKAAEGIGSLPAQKVNFDENTQDILEDILPRGAQIDNQGNLTLFHRTSSGAADKILETGEMTGKEPRLFFGTRPEGQISGYGDTVVEVKIPADKLELDDIFDDEAHLALRSDFKPQTIDVVSVTKPEGIVTLAPRKMAQDSDLAEQAETLRAIQYGMNVDTPVSTQEVFRSYGKDGVKEIERAFKSNQESIASAEDLVDRAMTVNDDFQANMMNIAQNVGGSKAGKFVKQKDGTDFDVEVKTFKSIQDKIDRKNIAPSEFTDGVRTTIYVTSADQANEAARRIGQLYPTLDDGWQRIPQTNYFDRKLNMLITDPSGRPVIGEVQLKTPEMAKAAEPGHRFYEYTRKLEGKYNTEIPQRKIVSYTRAMNQQQRLYADAAKKADPKILEQVIDKFRLGGAVVARYRSFRT